MLYAVASDRYTAARRAAAAYKRKARSKDLDPAKRARDLAALDPATRRRVEGFNKRAHL
jgi:hypothetical protein